VHALVAGDELVGEGETRHETTLLQPEDGGKGTGEEDTLDSSKGNKAESKCGGLIRDPTKSPVGLAADTRD